MVIIKIIFFIIISSYYSQVSIDVEGSAFIEDNISNARREAKKDAFINAIKVALINISKSPDLVKNNEFKLKYKIYSKTSEYIDSYNISSEEKTEDVLKLKMLIVVNTNKLKKDLIKYGISLQEMKIPKIISFIAEKKNKSMFSTTYLTKNDFTDIENNFSKYLSEKGFALINPYEDEQTLFPSANTFMFLKTSELSNYAKNYSADLISTGYVKTECNPVRLISEFRCTTVISIQILTAKLGKIIAAKKVRETYTGKIKTEVYNKSRASAVKSISDNLIFQLTKHWKKTKYKVYTLTIKNLISYDYYKNIKKSVNNKELKNIANILEKYQTSNSLTLNVDVSSNNFKKSRKLILRKIKENLSFKIMESNDENVTIKII